MKALVPGADVPAIVDDEGCWLWTGAKDRDGYGLVRTKQGVRRVHRVAWEEVNGQTLLPKDEIDHKCRKRACFNPRDLEKVTRLENERRKPGRRKSNIRFPIASCSSGHLLLGAVKLAGGGCRICSERHIPA